jgi:hypothetical protein
MFPMPISLNWPPEAGWQAWQVGGLPGAPKAQKPALGQFWGFWRLSQWAWLAGKNGLAWRVAWRFVGIHFAKSDQGSNSSFESEAR